MEVHTALHVTDQYAKWKDHSFLTYFSKLLQIPSPPAHEWYMGKLICTLISEIGFEPVTDSLGNIEVHLEAKNNNAPLTMLASHIDEIALVVTKIQDNGQIKVTNSGGISPAKLGEGPIQFIGDNNEQTIVGVTSLGGGHVAANDRLEPKWSDIGIITGLSPEQLKKNGIRVGSTAVPCNWRRGPVIFGKFDNPLLGAWTFDDRAGAVTLLRLLKRIKEKNFQPQTPTTIAFTTQEEGGCYGAVCLAQRCKPEVFIAVDGTPKPDDSPLIMDGSPCAWSKDKLAHSDQNLIRALRNAAEEAGTLLQTMVLEFAYSDASRVLATGGAQRIVTVGHIRENSHGFEVVPLLGFDNLLDTLYCYLQ